MAGTTPFRYPNLSVLSASAATPKTDPYSVVLWELRGGPDDEVEGLWDMNFTLDNHPELCPLGVACPEHGEAVLAAYKPAGHDHGLPF